MNAVIAIAMLISLTPADDSKSDSDRIQGTWVLIRMESEGKNVQQEMIIRGEYHLMVEGNKVIVNQEGKIVPMGTVKLDPTQRPRVYDRVGDDDRLSRGIYELDRDSLKICLGFPGADRPTGFSTKPGEQSRLMVYKRYEPRPAAAALGAERSVQQILMAIDSPTMSAFDVKRLEDRKYLREYQARDLRRTEKRAELILELYKAAPNHERIPTLMVERWRRVSSG